MSVVNKMLRDLDQRAGTSNAEAIANPLAAGTRSVPRAPAQVAHTAPRARLFWLLGATVLVVGASLFAMSRLSEPAVQTAAPVAPVAAPTMPVAVAPVALAASAPAVAPAPVPALGAALVALDAPMALRMDVHLGPRDTRSQLAPAMAPAPAASPSAAPPPARVERSFQDTEQVVQRQQQGGKEAMAQAQILWNGGNTDGAMALMREAVVRAERAANANTGQPSSAVLVPLVQELSRMELALGHTAEAWDLLSRMEPRLAGQADLWALRANAAQRLSRHEDSVHSYMEALQLRPDEQRWQLGLAVSLAALGRTSAAAEVAEKARAMGPVSRDVLGYLRQMGVPLKDK